MQAVKSESLQNPFAGTELEGLSEDEIIRKYEHYIKATIHKQLSGGKTFLNLHGLTEDDLMQYGRLGLLYAIRTFNPEKSDFLTYAINCIFWTINSEAKKDSLYNQSNYTYSLADTCSLNETVSVDADETDMEYGETIADENDHIGDLEVEMLIEGIREDIPDKLYQYIKLRYQGYTFDEIGDMFGTSRQAVQQYLKRHQDKLHKLFSQQ